MAHLNLNPHFKVLQNSKATSETVLMYSLVCFTIYLMFYNVNKIHMRYIRYAHTASLTTLMLLTHEGKEAGGILRVVWRCLMDMEKMDCVHAYKI